MDNRLQSKVFEYLEEHPRATLEELYQVFSYMSQQEVRLAIAELYSSNKITSITVYLPMPKAKEG